MAPAARNLAALAATLQEQQYAVLAMRASDHELEDELENWQQDLTRVGGDPQTDIQQAFDQHRSLETQAAALPKNTARGVLESAKSLHSVIAKVRILSSLKDRYATRWQQQIERRGMGLYSTIRILHCRRTEVTWSNAR